MATQEFLTQHNQLTLLRERLANTYEEIEARAVSMIRQGEVVDNPILTGEKQDTRYALATIAMITGRADMFCSQATAAVQQVEPDMRVVPDGFRHVTLQLNFSRQGRRSILVDAKVARAYYEALRQQFSSSGKPIRLELLRVLPTIDQEQASVSVVGAFLPVDDMRIIEVRRQVRHAAEQSGLPLVGRLGEIRVIFSTLGRLPHPPRREGETAPLLDAIDHINGQIPKACDTVIEMVDILSTTRISYMGLDKHIFMEPSLSLVKPNRAVKPRFVSATQKNLLDKVRLTRSP
ncbi:MAG: hypothetical protein HY429_03835 [Candidatus Levybacteria bacterium]|nr:hypothetical protein [Candidatus Levybacteria bacterium]